MSKQLSIQFHRNRHWSSQLRYSSLFACETSHYLCTGSHAKAEKLAVVLAPVCHLRAPIVPWVLIRMGKPRLR